jgi:zinc-binding in reverse transcriptase
MYKLRVDPGSDETRLLPRTHRLHQYQQLGIDRPRYCSDPDYDAIVEIDRLQKSLSISTTSVPRISPGSAEAEAPPAQNQRELMIAADLAATRLRRASSHHRPRCLLPLPTCSTYVLHQNQPMTSLENVTLRTSHNRGRLWQYVIERHAWDKRTAARVNLNALRAARNKDHTLHRFTTRLLHGHLPTRRRLHQQGQTSSNLCPLCQNEETHDHMFQCSHREEWRTGFLEQLTEHLTDQETDPTVSTELLTCTRSWLTATNPNPDSHCDQISIGVHLLHRGLVGIDWSYRQQTHYQANDNPLYGHQWTRNLILFFWDEANELWSATMTSTTPPQHFNTKTLSNKSKNSTP